MPRIRYRHRASHNVALPRHWTRRRVDELRAALLLLLVALASCIEPKTPATCSKAPHIDTTGHRIVCACVCEIDPAAECPRYVDDRSTVPACWDADATSSSSSSGGGE